MNLEDAAAQLASSLYLKFVLSFHIVVSSVGIVALSVMEWNRNNPSDILIASSYCIIRRTPAVIAIWGSIFSQMAMAVERYRASNNLANYETTSTFVGHLLNTAHILAVVLATCIQMPFYGSDWTATHCTLLNPSKFLVGLTVAIIIFFCELTTIVSFKRLLARNIRIRDSSESDLTLSERYQLTENIRMLKLLNPIIWTHTSLGMLGTLFYLILLLIFPSPAMYPVIEETINMLDLQGICMPFIFMFRFRQERRHQEQVHSVNTSTGVELASYYEKAITEGW